MGLFNLFALVVVTSVVVIGAVAALAHGHLSTEPRTTQTLRTARRTDDLENAR